eukprot:12339503-Karenia_brevis.AAC.2
MQLQRSIGKGMLRVDLPLWGPYAPGTPQFFLRWRPASALSVGAAPSPQMMRTLGVRPRKPKIIKRHIHRSPPIRVIAQYIK